MNDRGEWLCRPCHARAQAIATTQMHQQIHRDEQERVARWPFWVAGGIIMLILLGILRFLLLIGEGFGRAL